MAQRLIIEGKDAYVLSELCRLWRLGLPVGYNAASYGREFVKSAGGIDNVPTIIREELRSPEVTNIGIVVDANSVGVRTRCQSIVAIIADTLPEASQPKVETIGSEGLVWDALGGPGRLRVGIFIMPDNRHEGYLEHFLESIIVKNTEQLRASQAFLDELSAASLSLFKPTHRQKALMYTFLAIQYPPGDSATTALKKGIFDYRAKPAEHFINWFRNTFQLEG
ncbi:hypothetical protein GGR28_000914 [Lewinella aquimaris]|uniref:Uncharacterized protein n=1 Tax=Neolewinella aquimaris TaxID=1835722 RepID=A0A840DZ85_9BACT|nr:DUF3226 domain-containing protein [Neolewinella aquimaris]MBB4078301.1 hypothetical protein [Neolewinella aquimaris]